MSVALTDSVDRVGTTTLCDDGHAAMIAEFRRKKRRSAVMLQVYRALVLVCFIGAWQLFSGVPGSSRWVRVDSYYVSQPSDMFDAGLRWWRDGTLQHHIFVTFRTLLLGFGLGVALGLALGFVLGITRRLSEVLLPFITVLYSLPRLALVPLFLLWFGLGLMSQVMFVTSIVFFLVFFNTYSGVRDVDQSQLNTLRLMGANTAQVHAKVTLPSALTWILAGMRISAPYALVAAVTAEMLSSNEGVGYLAQRSANQFNTDGTFAAIFVMICMGLVVNGAVGLVERYLLSWKQRGKA